MAYTEIVGHWPPPRDPGRSVKEKETAMRVTSVIIMCGMIAGSVCGGETTITINGKTIRTSGNNVTINNDTVIVDGKVLSGQSGEAVKGSGKIATEKRDLGMFTELRQNISANVTVKAGAKGQCTITADENILPLIVTECAGNALRITCKESYMTSQRVRIAIETPLITKAEMAGSGEIDISDVTKDKIVLVLSGSGDIRAKGQAAELDATINGSGNIQADGLKAGAVKVAVNGSGNAKVHATDSLTTEIRGSGEIIYGGNPTQVRNSVSGSGTVAKE
jgi:hypothetical protein